MSKIFNVALNTQQRFSVSSQVNWPQF